MSAGSGLATRPRVYLLDVEGTTSPVSLVSEQLFPYARRHLGVFLRDPVRKAEIQADLALLVKENRAEADAGAPRVLDVSDLDKANAYLLWLMDRDRKSTALKSLQGQVWKSGYLAGELVGTVFADVPEAFERWSREAKVAIYSSGSVEAQKLIFRYSSAGDLTPLISGYFDTRTGPKTSAESYRVIAAAMGVEPAEILFVSDVVRELDPAREAGCETRLSVREGNQPGEEVNGDTKGHAAIRSFAEMD
jgi:enolase-phosphatase E1